MHALYLGHRSVRRCSIEAPWRQGVKAGGVATHCHGGRHRVSSVAAGDVASDGVTVVGFVLGGQKKLHKKVTYIFTNVMFTQ